MLYSDSALSMERLFCFPQACWWFHLQQTYACFLQILPFLFSGAVFWINVHIIRHHEFSIILSWLQWMGTFASHAALYIYFLQQAQTMAECTVQKDVGITLQTKAFKRESGWERNCTELVLLSKQETTGRGKDEGAESAALSQHHFRGQKRFEGTLMMACINGIIGILVSAVIIIGFCGSGSIKHGFQRWL